MFLPSKILGRQKQAEQLIQYIDSLKEGLLVPVISVYGRSGAGKSTVVKFVCQNMSDVLLFSFVNLRKAKTVFGCANLILSELGLANLKSAQGMNKSIDSMEERILEILDKENKKFFDLILDEYDVIFSDPLAIENTKQIFDNKIFYSKKISDSLRNSECAVIMTPWTQYSKLTNKNFQKMKKRIIVDTRRLLANKKLDASYHAIGIGT